jgi:predicted transcriptional regulator
MQTLKVKIEALDNFLSSAADTLRASASVQTTEHTYSFPSWEALHSLLTPERLTIVQVMAGQGVLTTNDIASRTGRDVGGVQSDVDMLVNSGVIDQAASGVLFPYDRIHLELEIEAAA